MALAEYDKTANGGNNYGDITAQDSIFGSLRLWQDTNHNGISEATELKTPSTFGVAKIELDYKESKPNGRTRQSLKIPLERQRCTGKNE